jgi:two-component system, cell cycle sensor histidine kinase DivJ
VTQKTHIYQELRSINHKKHSCAKTAEIAFFSRIRRRIRPAFYTFFKSRVRNSVSTTRTSLTGINVRVLSNISSRMAAFTEGLTQNWLPGCPEGHVAHPLERNVLKAIFATGTWAMPVVPTALCLALSPAVALPAGVAIVGASTLLASVAAIAIIRALAAGLGDQFRAETKAMALDETAILDKCPGLFTRHDVRGFVTDVRGRDRKTLLPWLRDAHGLGFVEVIHISDRIEFFQALDNMRMGADTQSLALRMERAGVSRDEKQFVHVGVEMTAERDADGVLTGFIAHTQDKSEWAALKNLAASESQAVRSANEAKTRFLAAVSHELRTPLNAILGFSDILRGEYFGALANDRQREYVGLVYQSGTHLLSVVNTMLDMSKIENGRYELMPEPFNIVAAVRTCEAMLEWQAQNKGVALNNRVTRDLGEVNADQRAIQQILINLVGNAIKFTEPGGAVTIDAAIVGGDLAITVSDTGIGIAADMLEQVGKPFVQLQSEYSRQYEGTGLGLSLVKGLVALHGGTFDITSEPGKGTAISVTISIDGSGAENYQAAADQENRIEFPPVLKNAATRTEITFEEPSHDHAKAKSA